MATIIIVTVRDAIEHQLGYDRERERGPQAMFAARVRATIAAQRAFSAHEIGAKPALRAALVDLAAVSELLAEDLGIPEPPEPVDTALF